MSYFTYRVKIIIERIFTFLKKWYTIVGIIFTILGWIAFKDTIKSWFTSEHARYTKDYFIPGILLPDEIKNDSLITFDIGFAYFKIKTEHLKDSLNKGLGYVLVSPTGGPLIDLGIYLKENRLLFSMNIFDLQRDEIVGTLNYNHWSLFKPNFLDYYFDDKSLEIIDRQNNVVFSIKLLSSNKIRLRGYFSTDSNVTVLSDSGLITYYKDSTNYKKDALVSIKNIHRLSRLSNDELNSTFKMKPTLVDPDKVH